MDTLVFDIETQNFFTDPNVGWNNFGALKISVVGIYSYRKNAYLCFEESEMEALAAFFRESKTLVGFSSNRYDVPVLNLYFKKLAADKRVDLWKKERVDMLEDMEIATGMRISLSRLAEANLGEKKEGHGSQAIGLYEQGRIDELKRYCLKDVELTKKLYDLYVGRGYLFVPNRVTGELEKIYVKKESTTSLL